MTFREITRLKSTGSSYFLLLGVGVSCRISYSIYSYLYVRCREQIFYYRLLVLMWFLFGGVF